MHVSNNDTRAGEGDVLKPVNHLHVLQPRRVPAETIGLQWFG